MDSWKTRWGVSQWAAYFENQALPVMNRSKLLLAQLDASEGDLLAPRHMVDIVLQDPLLCLRLLREAETRKTHRLGNETTTALAAIMQLGVDEFRTLLETSPEVDETNTGLLSVEHRARIASHIALAWAAGRMDLNPEEVAVATLLSGTGDLLLWAYAPELPEKAEACLQSGLAKRSAEAQTQSCGFTFKQLTQQCAERWKLPSLLIQLLRGSESERARLTRACSNAARHLLDTSETANLALATDLVEASQLIHDCTLDWLIDGLPELPEARRAALNETARNIPRAAPESGQ